MAKSKRNQHAYLQAIVKWMSFVAQTQHEHSRKHIRTWAQASNWLVADWLPVVPVSVSNSFLVYYIYFCDDFCSLAFIFPPHLYSTVVRWFFTYFVTLPFHYSFLFLYLVFTFCLLFALSRSVVLVQCTHFVAFSSSFRLHCLFWCCCGCGFCCSSSSSCQIPSQW